MKLSKSVLLSIALFGASASIFSYAAVTHNVTGATAEARGQHFKTLLNTAAAGDEIVFTEEVKLLQGTGNLNIPNVTIKGNNNVLHLEGYNLNLTGDATFNNLKLSLVPTRTLSESFAGFGNKGADAKPTLIVTNGNSLTLDAVTTKVEKAGENDGTRPIILLGGGNGSKPETLTITNSTTETKLYGIAIDGKRSLNSNGELIKNSTDSASNAVTLNIGSNTNVLGGISVSDNDDININSKSSNLSKIDTGNTTNVNLTISEVSSVGASGVLNTNPNAKFKSLNLDGVVVTLQNGNPYSTNNISIDTLSLKDGGGIKSGNSFNEEDNLTVVVDNLKSEGKNTLVLDSGELEVKSVEIKSGTLGVGRGITFPDNIDTDEDGNYVPPKREETPPPPPSEESSSSPDKNPNTQPENPPSGSTNTENTGTGTGVPSNTEGGDKQDEPETATGGENGAVKPSKETSENGVTDTSGQQPPTNKPTEPSTEGTTTTSPTDTKTEDQPSGKEGSAESEVDPKLSEGNTEGGSTSTPEAQPANPSNTGNAANGGAPVAPTVQPGGEQNPPSEDEKLKTETPAAQPGDTTTENGNSGAQTGDKPANPSTGGEQSGGKQDGEAPSASGVQPVTPPAETVQPESNGGNTTDPNPESPNESETDNGSQEPPVNGGNQVPPKTEGGEQPTPVQPEVTDPKNPTTSETAAPEKAEGSDKGEDTAAPNKEEPAVTPPNTNNNGGAAGSEGGNNEAEPSVNTGSEKPATDDKPQGDDPNANGSTADTGANNNADATKPVTPAEPSEKPADKPAEKPVTKPAETPKEKPAEKSIQERITDALKGLFTKAHLNKKQQQQAVEKTEESLSNLTRAYTDYDFSFSLDAARVTEDRLNDLTMFNDLESASIDNYAFLAQSAKALKNHNSVWVNSSLAEQRGDGDSKRRLSTINLGYDRQFDNLIVGGFVSYLRQKGERGELSSKLHGYSFSLYGKYYQNAHEVIALLNTGRTKAELQRNISVLGVSNQADAKGKFIGLRVEYGYRMPFEAHNLQVKPLVGLSYNLGRQAAFTESGSMPVHVGKIKAQRLSLETGVELRKYFETAYVYVKPTIQTDLMARSNDVDVLFVNSPNSIPFKSTAKKKTYFALSLGTQMQLRKNLLLDLNANSRIGNNERDIQGSIKLNYKF